MAKKSLSKIQKALIAVAAVILVLVIAGGIYCISTDQNPADAAKSVFTSNDEQIIGKWQSQKSPGISAFVFYEDGTYDSYISTANFSGTYEINGSKITLKNPSTSKEIVYKFSVNEKVLTLNLIEEDGTKTEEDEVSKYDRVDELNQKSIIDILSESKEENEETTVLVD
jgi:hypothetical protein